MDIGTLSLALLLLAAEPSAVSTPPGVASPSSPPATPAQAGDHRLVPTLRLFALPILSEGLIMSSDGHFDGDIAADLGLEGDVLWAYGGLHAGFGLRYQLAYVPPASGQGTRFDHFLSPTFLIGGGIPIVDHHEIEILLAIGAMGGLMQGGATSDGSSYMRTIGPSVELSVSYWTQIRPGLELSFGAGVGASLFKIENGGTYFANNSGIHTLVPLRVGGRWSL